MKDQITKLAGVVFTCAFIAACSSDNSGVSLNSGPASSGDADFTKFVSIGDSLTAGYADGALYLLGQTNSYPNILATQFADADGVAVDFTQPLVSDDLGGLLFNGVFNPAFDNRLVLNAATEAPERLAGTPTTEVIGSGLNGMSFNNLGVPGAKSFHLLSPIYGDFAGLNPDPDLATANPYFIRFATDATTSMIAQAGAAAASFYVMWVGNNDVLSYATSGGVGVDRTGDPDFANNYNSNDITDPGIFDTFIYPTLVGAFTAANANVQGVLINIPDISTIPFFTTVPFNPVPLTQTQADDLNLGYAVYNAGIAIALAANPDELARRTINFVEGQNAVVIDTILDPGDLTDLSGGGLPSFRHATSDDLIVLPAASVIGTELIPGDETTVIGLGVPLEDKDVLIPSEIQAINTARTAFNVTIKAAADADANLVFVDAAAIMEELSTSGIAFGTGSINSDFATGGAFSLDGVHPTGRGYAVIANAIIDAINSGFNANVHKVDPAGLPTIFLK